MFISENGKLFIHDDTEVVAVSMNHAIATVYLKDGREITTEPQLGRELIQHLFR